MRADSRPRRYPPRYTEGVRRFTVTIALSLFLSGCSYQDVNQYSPFKYRSSDDAGDIALKTAGNILPWTGETVLAAAVFATIGGFILGIAYLQGQSGQ